MFLLGEMWFNLFGVIVIDLSVMWFRRNVVPVLTSPLGGLVCKWRL